MSEKDGGTAFPNQAQYTESGKFYLAPTNGMTLRDYFAAKALNGILFYLSGDDWNNGGMKPSTIDRYAESSYRLADAMLKAREAK